MNTIFEYLIVALVCFVLASLRYLVMIGLYYIHVYQIFQKQLFKYKINPTPPQSNMIRSEIFWGLFNNINFSIVGMLVYSLYKNNQLSLFFNFYDYSWTYHILLVFILLLLHDTYFFWIHWLMHKTRLGKWARHDIHHSADNVTPWSAFSVHPLEGFLEVVFRLFTLWLIPMHPYDAIFFEVLTFALNIIGHSGYEFFPKNYTSFPLTKSGSCATFHYMHHQNGGTNLSLFFNHWDQWMGTMNPQYEIFYQQVVKRRNTVTQKEHSHGS